MSDFLKRLSDFLDSEPYDVIRISSCVSGGEIETLERQELAFCQNTYSVAKAFTMTAIGLLYDKGLVTPEDKMCDILREYVPERLPDERVRLITVHQLLTHSAGLPGGFLDIDVHKSSEFTEDFLKYTLTYPLDYEPGTQSKYSDGAFYLLSRIAAERAGEKMDDFLWKELFLKLDFQEAAWSHCPRGHAMGATGLYINSSDMVKLGMLYLNGGVYNGKRILSEKWVNTAIERDYGFGKNEDGSYSKGGMNGQSLLVIPSQKRAVAIQSYGGNSGRIAQWIIENG